MANEPNKKTVVWYGEVHSNGDSPKGAAKLAESFLLHEPTGVMYQKIWRSSYICSSSTYVFGEGKGQPGYQVILYTTWTPEQIYTRQLHLSSRNERTLVLREGMVTAFYVKDSYGTLSFHNLFRFLTRDWVQPPRVKIYLKDNFRLVPGE